MFLDDEAIGQYKTVADIPRAYHGVAYVNGYIYVIGGFDGVNYFNTVRRMDVRTFDWIQVHFRYCDVNNKRVYLGLKPRQLRRFYRDIVCLKLTLYGFYSRPQNVFRSG